MIAELVLVVCVAGQCVTHRPEDDRVFFHGSTAVQDCKNVRDVITRITREQFQELGILAGVVGICPIAVKEPIEQASR